MILTIKFEIEDGQVNVDASDVVDAIAEGDYDGAEDLPTDSVIDLAENAVNELLASADLSSIEELLGGTVVRATLTDAEFEDDAEIIIPDVD